VTREYTSDGADEADVGADTSDLAIAPPRRAVRWLMGLIAIVVALSMTVLLFPRSSSPTPRGSDQVTGIVRSVSSDGATVCLELEANGTPLCSGLYQGVGSARIQVGEHVTGSYIIVGAAQELLFLMTSPAAS
jgi:hypothetical protein